MAIERYIVSKDPEHYESFPDIAQLNSGELLCVFNELKSHGDRSYSRVAMVRSQDKGKTWSEKEWLVDATHSEDASSHWDCPRVSVLEDGRVAMLCGYFKDKEHLPVAYLWIGDEEGKNFEVINDTLFAGIVPDKLFVTSSGRWIVTCHYGDLDGFTNLQQRMWYSDDEGKTWEGPIIIGKDERYNLCEGSIIELEPGTLACLMRENSALNFECPVALSHDNGETWGEIHFIPLSGCHRPVAGHLSTGEILVTYRYRQGSQFGWLGHWTQNTFLAITDKETILSEGDRKKQKARIMPLNYDTSYESDLGYTGWVELENEEIYIVDYMRGEEPKCYIHAVSLTRDDIGGERLGSDR